MPNQLNYGNLEACRRLVDAGIVLETEAVWYVVNADLYYKEHVKIFIKDAPEKYIPAPSMAEVWRELPDCYGSVNGLQRKALIVVEGLCVPGYILDGEFTISVQSDTNPTDTLINLLILVRKEKAA